MGDRGELGVAAICCLLHSLGPGGSTWQWIRLLERHVERGGRATIVAEPGPLAGPARAAGIEVLDATWQVAPAAGVPWHAVDAHDAAVVQGEKGVIAAFDRALQACGRAALTLHQSPQAVSRWFAPPTPEEIRLAVRRAAAEPHAAVLVRGEAHRRKVASAYDIADKALRTLPPSVPLASLPFRPQLEQPTEVLAMTRLAPGKMAIARMAAELVRERLAAGEPCRLTIAGDGTRSEEALAICEARLPPGSWRIEGPPADPLATLAEAQLVVAQGLTTLEAAALGRRVVVARPAGTSGASGAVLRPDVYDEAARDPFGDPPLTEEPARLWDEVLALEETELANLRDLVEHHNSPQATSSALAKALAAASEGQ
jgi:hypothetical protein